MTMPLYSTGLCRGDHTILPQFAGRNQSEAKKKGHAALGVAVSSRLCFRRSSGNDRLLPTLAHAHPEKGPAHEADQHRAGFGCCDRAFETKAGGILSVLGQVQHLEEESVEPGFKSAAGPNREGMPPCERGCSRVAG